MERGVDIVQVPRSHVDVREELCRITACDAWVSWKSNLAITHAQQPRGRSRTVDTERRPGVLWVDKAPLQRQVVRLQPPTPTYGSGSTHRGGWSARRPDQIDRAAGCSRQYPGGTAEAPPDSRRSHLDLAARTARAAVHIDPREPAHGIARPCIGSSAHVHGNYPHSLTPANHEGAASRCCL